MSENTAIFLCPLIVYGSNSVSSDAGMLYGLRGLSGYGCVIIALPCFPVLPSIALSLHLASSTSLNNKLFSA